MNTYEKALLDCKIGIKAFQNINASSMGFAKMLDVEKIKDPVLMSSVFYWAVIRYVKPFLNSKFEGGLIRYPIKSLKKANGFSVAMHEHLITIRSTLIAHDDFTEIPPRLLKFGIHLTEEDFFIPTAIAISNKCISFPISSSVVQQMHAQALACSEAVHSKLIEDIVELRKITLSNPEIAMKDQTNKNDYGKVGLEREASLMRFPDFMNDQWLKVPVPDYSELHKGYMYEEARIKKDFHCPEKITTPTGLEFNVSPPELE